MASGAIEPSLVAAAGAESACRNCGASVTGSYCATCGQETALALPTARQFVKEAAGRYVSLDGRLWRTLGVLMFQPGLLTRAYLAGRRRRYIRPARLFLALSILAFAVMRFAIDTTGLRDEAFKIDASDLEAGKAAAGDDDRAGLGIRFDDGGNLSLTGASGPIGAEVKRRVDRFNALPREAKSEQLVANMMRYGPYAMVAMLPLFAGLLQLVHLGRARRYPTRPRRYAEHLVYAAHHHAFLFIVAMLMAVLPWSAARDALVIAALVHGVLSMKAVYGGRWIGTIARSALLVLVYLVLFVFVIVGLVIAAVIL